MKSRLYVNRARARGRHVKLNSVFCVVGSWDPLVREHIRLFQRLAKASRAQACDSLVVLLTPAPASFIGGNRRWPVHSHFKWRIEQILSAGVSAVLTIAFRKKDMDLGAEELVRTIAKSASLKELWLGTGQSLGPGPKGDRIAVRALSHEYRFKVRTLGKASAARESGQAREWIAKGRLRKANRLAVSPSTWPRPRNGRLRLNWPSGRYRVLFLEDVNEIGAESMYGERRSALFKARTVRLSASGSGDAELHWPDPQAKWMQILSGPSDV